MQKDLDRTRASYFDHVLLSRMDLPKVNERIDTYKAKLGERIDKAVQDTERKFLFMPYNIYGHAGVLVIDVDRRKEKLPNSIGCFDSSGAFCEDD